MVKIKALWNEDRYKDEEEEDVYGEEAREALMEDDELSPEEAGFMNGYSQALEK